MSEFPGVTFLPWIGEHYGRGSCFGFRLLVLGDSHYAEEGEEVDSDFTRYVVRRWGQTQRLAFFTVVEKVLRQTDEWIGDEVRGEMWNHVAFYNFAQSVVSGPRTAPTFRQWCEAQAPFATVLQGLRPDAVLILGSRLDEHVLERPDGIEFGVITHPSGGLCYADAIPAFGHLLRRTRARIAAE